MPNSLRSQSERSIRARRAAGMVLLVLGLIAEGCEAGERVADAGDVCSSADPRRSPGWIDADVQSCSFQSGALLEPATPGTIAVASTSLALIAHAAEGSRAVLPVPGSVQAQTVDGLTLDCYLSTGHYSCEGPGTAWEPSTSVLHSVTASVGGQTWTKPVGTCSQVDHQTDFWLDDLTVCVDPGTVVLEGVLLDYVPGEDLPASVGLFGEPALLFGGELCPAIIPDPAREIPYRPCVVEGNRYACTTLGYRMTTFHQLRVEVGDHVTDESFKLEVDDCQAHALRADVQACPLLPDALPVEVRAAGDAPLPPLVATATYEGGSPYPCLEAPYSTRYATRFLCPAAHVSPHGEGHYEIVASAGARSWRAVHDRRSNGCKMSAGPLVLGSDQDEGGSNRDAERDPPDAHQPAEQAGDAVDRRARSAGEDCLWIQGYIGGPLTPETIGVEPHSPPARSQVAQRPAMLNLTHAVDRVQAETKDGRVIECSHASKYVCTDRAGIVSVSVFIGEQSWTKDVRGEYCPSYPLEHFVNFWLDDLAWCVEPGTVVLEGSLLGYDPAGELPVSVELLGAPFGYIPDQELDGMLSQPYRRCEVSGDRYRCTTLGYRTTAEHRLRVVVGNERVVDGFRLRVDGCQAPVLQADVQACPLAPLEVEIFPRDQQSLPSLQVTASHAGGAPYPCLDISHSIDSLRRTFQCPAALGSDRGAGVYEVVARSGERLFRGKYERIFNGCTASDGPLTLRDEAEAE